ncbi:hypothetical protein ACJU26_09640 [Acidithiobacillus sp. M4-SHS-6]|uniref:hypothetical protein n=1 Tax=Acidithiobacillus sp. M4-SHS-6 TaxID=3383024 RepID=UPI0039BE0961
MGQLGIREYTLLWVTISALTGCGSIVLPAANPPSVSIARNFWQTGQYVQVDKGIAFIGAHSNARRYWATWDPVTDNLTAHIRGSRHRHWQITGVGTAELCHAFPVGWCFDVRYFTGASTGYVRYEVLQEKGAFLITAR